MAPSVLILLVNWNGWRDTIACLQSCLALDHPGVRIMVCDNGSTDSSVGHILAWAKGEAQPPGDPSPVPLDASRRPAGVAHLDRAAAERGEDGDNAQLLVVDTGGNLGFAGGNNVGLRWALSRDCDYVWLLNNDTVVPSDALSVLVRRMEADTALGLCGSLMAQFERPTLAQGLAGATRRDTLRGRHLAPDMPIAQARGTDPATLLRPGETLYPIGASMLVSRAFLRDIGLMEEAYFLYYEEIDWVLRAEGRFGIAIEPSCIVYHRVGASTGWSGERMSSRAAGYLFRSRLIAARRFAKGHRARVVLGLIDEAVRALLHGRMAKPIGAFNALTGRVRPPTAKVSRP